MNMQSFLDDLLKTSKELAEKGKNIAEDKLNIPESGEEREVALGGMKKGAIAAGTLALLLGTGAGRKLTGLALRLGSVAAVGGVAYKAYKNWQNKQTVESDSDRKTLTLNDFESANDKVSEEERSEILLKAMVAAAKADGHIDATEKDLIIKQAQSLALEKDILELIEEEIEKDLDATAIAALSLNMAIASEIYLVSSVIANKENAQEKAYLASLADALKLPTDLIDELESTH